MMLLEKQQTQQLHLQVEKLVKTRIEDARQLKLVWELLQSCQSESEAADVETVDPASRLFVLLVDVDYLKN